LTLSDILQTHFDIQIVDYQCIKTIDTLVFHARTADDKSYVVKLYREHNRELVQKIQHIAPFLHFIRLHTNLVTQAPALPHFPLVDWEGEKRYVIVSDWIEGDVPTVLDTHFMKKLGAMTAQLHNAAENFATQLPILRIDNDLIQKVKPQIYNQRKYLIVNEIDVERAFLGIHLFYNNQNTPPSVFGLIHSDIHFTNVLEKGNALIPIDFDDLAYSHYLLDIGIVFNEIEIFLEKKDALQADDLKAYFVAGYTTFRVLPNDFKSQIIDFQRIASAIYLNWILNKGNEDLLNNEKLRGFTQSSLDKMVHTPSEHV
jgi:Ser/Thr protein kinase RdoA (MazF antagonist)